MGGSMYEHQIRNITQYEEYSLLHHSNDNTILRISYNQKYKWYNILDWRLYADSYKRMYILFLV